MKEITEIYELAMYSRIDASKELAVRALESVKNISYKLNSQSPTPKGSGHVL